MPATLPPDEDKPGVPAPPPLFFAAPFLALWAAELLAPTTLGAGTWRWVGGWVLVVAGAALNLVAAATQRRAGTDFLPTRPTTRIVDKGPYAWTRNPMYVGFALVTLGLALLVDSAWATLAAPIGIALVDRLVVAREERYLERKFGDEYVSYTRRVRRWL